MAQRARIVFTPRLSPLEDRWTPSIVGDITDRVNSEVASRQAADAAAAAQAAAVRQAQEEAIKAKVPTDRATNQAVFLFNPDGSDKARFATYTTADTGGIAPTGGMWVARGDVNGDGVIDTVTAPGAGIIPKINVYDGRSASLTQSYVAYGGAADLANSFKGGVFVTLGDFDGDGADDIVLGTDQGGGPRVQIISGKNSNTIIADFFAIDDPTFRGGVRVAAGDINGDGRDDLIVSAGYGGGPRIAAYDGTKLKGITADTRANATLFSDFFAFENGLRNGAYLTVGYVNNDKYADVIFGGGPGGAPRVLVLDGARLAAGDTQGALDNPLANFFAGSTNDRGGVRVGTSLGDDKLAKILIANSGGDAIVFDLQGNPLKTINREIALNGGLQDDTATRTGASPIADRVVGVSASLIGSYAALYTTDLTLLSAGTTSGTPTTGQVQVTLNILSANVGAGSGKSLSALKNQGGTVQATGTLVVRVGGRPDLVTDATLIFTLDSFPNSDSPQSGTLALSTIDTYRPVNGTFAWTPNGLTTTSLSGMLQDQYTFNRAASAVTLAKGATVAAPVPPPDFAALTINSLKGTYTGTYVTPTTFTTPLSNANRAVTAILEVTTVTAPSSLVDPRQGGFYTFTGKITVKVATKPDISFAVTGNITVDSFVGKSAPTSARFSFNATGGTASGSNLTWSPTGLTGTQASGSRTEWRFSDATAPFTWSRS